MKIISHENEPVKYEEAIPNPAWKVAMTQEFEALYANNTLKLLTLPKGKNIAGSKWVYKIKHR